MSIYTKRKVVLGVKKNIVSHTYMRGDKIDEEGKLIGGKMIKRIDIPGNIMELLKNQDAVDDAELGAPEAPRGFCIFCKELTKLKRTVNQQTVDICEKHYYDCTIGQIAQQINLLAAPKVVEGAVNG